MPHDTTHPDPTAAQRAAHAHRVAHPRETPYVPAWWLPGAHVRTIWRRLARTGEPVAGQRHWLDTPDDDELELVRVPAARPGAPRLLVLHGLEGTPASHYVHALFAAAQRRGWGTDLLLFRTCGSRPNRRPRSYHSGETTDLDLVLRTLAAESDAPVGIVGVSLGGNVLLKYLGEQGDGAPAIVRGAVAISVPYDLARASRWIGRGFGRVYERSFLATLIAKANAKIAQFPGLIDPAPVRAARTLWDFDDHFTAPVHGFADAADYYARSSSIHFLPGIRRPALLLSAADDPFLPAQVLDDVRQRAQPNPALTPQFVARGGHVGFLAGPHPWRTHPWAESRAIEWLAPHLEPDPR
jgi:predicted alpha/beta-fold hydrolase